MLRNKPHFNYKITRKDNADGMKSLNFILFTVREYEKKYAFKF